MPLEDDINLQDFKRLSSAVKQRRRAAAKGVIVAMQKINCAPVLNSAEMEFAVDELEKGMRCRPVINE